ncbi:MAG: hemerythrin domain-containing protein [Rubrobacter sp.]|jgi:iron-sulfur cluster repair protein YtfE (RIC family)|nr:hemerythrin domain-containing protein [Rubrobacter sp.]
MEELEWVHNAIRHDLRVCGDLAEAVAFGADAGRVAEEVESLKNESVLWRIRVSCLTYCRFVHLHHWNEDVNIFPGLRRSNPALSPVVDRLEADHRKVSDLLDEVEESARTLAASDEANARTRLASALEGLGAHLLEHLAFEEEAIAPTVLEWEGWPTR